MSPEKGVHVPRTHPPYSPEFRAQAIRLVREGGRTPTELAQELGCSHETIRLWLRQADRDAGRRDDGLTTDEREELRRLRREVHVLQQEREILKKAAAFFAKETL